jgi:hypothetical protein
MNQPAATTSFAAFVGIDWADQQHEVHVLGPKESKTQKLAQRAEAIGEWVGQLRQQYGDAPIAVAVEQQRGPLIHALMQYGNLILFPLNPKQLARYREARRQAAPKTIPAMPRCWPNSCATITRTCVPGSPMSRARDNSSGSASCVGGWWTSGPSSFSN